MSSYISNVTIA